MRPQQHMPQAGAGSVSKPGLWQPTRPASLPCLAAFTTSGVGSRRNRTVPHKPVTGVARQKDSRNGVQATSPPAPASHVSGLKAKLLDFTTLHLSPTHQAFCSSTQPQDDSPDSTTLQELCQLWATYRNEVAQAPAAQPISNHQHQSRRGIIGTTAAVLQPSVDGELRSAVQLLGRQLCGKLAFKAQSSAGLEACQQLASVVHSMGQLGVFDAGILALSEHHLSVCVAHGSSLPLRQAVQLINAYANLGHSPSLPTMLALIRTTSAGMHTAARTAQGRRSAHPQMPPVHGEAASAASTSQDVPVTHGTRPARVRLQAVARSLVDLTQALASLLPGCLATHPTVPHPIERGLGNDSKAAGSTSSQQVSTASQHSAINPLALPSSPPPQSPASLLLPAGLQPASLTASALPSQHIPSPRQTHSNDPLMAMLSLPGQQPSSNQPHQPTSTTSLYHRSDTGVSHQLNTALQEWRVAFLACSSVHIPALSITPLSAMLHACAQLRLCPDDAWWDSTVAATTSLLSSPAAHAPSRAAAVARALEALGAMKTSSMQSTGRPWLEGAMSDPSYTPPSALIQVLASRLQPESISQYGPDVLAPLFWCAAMLLGKEGSQQLLHTGHQRDAHDTLSAEPWTQAALEHLHGHLPLLSPTHVAHVIHGAALLGIRPYKSWIYLLHHQIQRHQAAFDQDASLQLVWSLATLHAPGCTPDPTTTSALVACLNRHLPVMQLADMVAARKALTRLYRKLRGTALAKLVANLDQRIQYAQMSSEQVADLVPTNLVHTEGTPREHNL